jgi:cyclopropane-fatty-acyl-phospholipid synthase
VGATLATRHQTFSADVVSTSSTALDRWALRRIQQTVRGAPIRFVLWDGFEIRTTEPPVGTIEFRNRHALFSWVRDPDLNFGETYMFGAVDIRGDLLAMLEAIYREPPSPTRFWQRWQAPNTFRLARKNVHHHYDLGNEFYKLWLDREMLYTCAYFPTPECSLEDAQIAKMDLVCRKLQLRPGERVVEAGCGWGALALHMAQRYGVTVQAFNVSTEQIAYARACAKAAQLADRVTFIEDDYRNVTGRHDVFVSVGMLEHVGLANFEALGDAINRTLTDAGRGLLHFIGRNRPAPLNRWIRRRIFPGAYPPTLKEVCEHVLEPASLSVLDVENLRLHYAVTLDHWRSRYERAADQVRSLFDEPFVRAWRLYLAGSQAAFTTGWLQLFQVVFARGNSNAIPWTRPTV